MKLLRECIVVAGKVQGGHVLGKTRDRNYVPHLKIVRDVINGVEVAYIHDTRTNYIEGMNANGVGIINAALLVSEDEAAAQKYWGRNDKKKGSSNDGPRILRALGQGTLQKCIKSLIGYDTGIKGHTLVGSPKSLYSIEMTSKSNPVVQRLDPSTGFDVRTNHGHDHPEAGYTADGFPEDYLSSKIRKANAEVALASVEEPDEVMPSLAKQQFEPDSNMNMLRKTEKMRSSSQVLMDLENQQLTLYVIPGECKYLGLEDNLPSELDPQIDVRVIDYVDPTMQESRRVQLRKIVKRCLNDL